MENVENVKMSAIKILWRSGCTLVLAGAVLGALYAQRPFRQYPSVEGYDSMPLPADWKRHAEWAFARLMYPPAPTARFGFRGRAN